MSFNGEKIFITGATGFVGANLVKKALVEGAEVSINIRKSSDTWRIRDLLKDVSVVYADLTEYEKTNDALTGIRPDVIFHTAVYGGNAVQKDVGKIIESNICGTVNLLRCCKNARCNLLVNTGSSSEYGIKKTVIKESDILEPMTDYGVSKAAATLFCQKAAWADNLPVITLRLFSPYGPYEQKTRLVPSVVLAALQKKRPRISSRDFVRDFIYIGDVMEAYRAVLDIGNPCGQIYNIGSGVQQTVGTVTDIIIRELGNEVTYETGLPRAWAEEPPCWQADITKAVSELKWRPEYSLKEGLGKTIEWFKENLKLYLPESAE